MPLPTDLLRSAGIDPDSTSARTWLLHPSVQLDGQVIRVPTALYAQTITRRYLTALTHAAGQDLRIIRDLPAPLRPARSAVSSQRCPPQIAERLQPIPPEIRRAADQAAAGRGLVLLHAAQADPELIAWQLASLLDNAVVVSEHQLYRVCSDLSQAGTIRRWRLHPGWLIYHGLGHLGHQTRPPLPLRTTLAELACTRWRQRRPLALLIHDDAASSLRDTYDADIARIYAQMIGHRSSHSTATGPAS